MFNTSIGNYYVVIIILLVQYRLSLTMTGSWEKVIITLLEIDGNKIQIHNSKVDIPGGRVSNEAER